MVGTSSRAAGPLRRSGGRRYGDPRVGRPRGGQFHVFAPTAWAATGVITPSVTASGTPGITSTVRTITTTTTNPTTVHIDLHFSVTQPANICRLSTGTCPPGYPAWQANLTITGYEAAGLTFDSANGGFACSEAAGVLSCHIDYLNNYFKNFDVYFTAAPTYGGDVSANLAVYDTTPADAAPTSKGPVQERRLDHVHHHRVPVRDHRRPRRLHAGLHPALPQPG